MKRKTHSKRIYGWKADAFIHENDAILSEKLVKQYFRGRGRYGAIPHGKSALLTLVLQQRDKPFQKKAQDPLEPLKDILRDKKKDWVPHDPIQIVEQAKSRRPSKPLYN
jgi:hypothetical protein